jgi:regulatory protein YycH of two-component signal transduction system YycFG
MITTHPLHAAHLKNNCPECFANDGLEFSFSQEQINKKLFTRVEKNISEKLYCYSCENIIYPVNWNDDIERVYLYHKKQAIPKQTSVKLTKLGHLLLVSALLCITLITVVFYYNTIGLN